MWSVKYGVEVLIDASRDEAVRDKVNRSRPSKSSFLFSAWQMCRSESVLMSSNREQRGVGGEKRE